MPSLKTELVALLDSAEKKILQLDALAVSERNRLLDAFGHARSTVHSSMDAAVDAEPAKQDKTSK